MVNSPSMELSFPAAPPVANLSIDQKIAMQLAQQSNERTNGASLEETAIVEEGALPAIVEVDRPSSPIRKRKQPNPKQIVSVKEEAVDMTDEAVTARSLRCQFEGPYCTAFDTREGLFFTIITYDS